MVTFSKQVLKLLNDYKLILKKHHGHSEWSEKIDHLGLRRHALKQDNELGLYQKAQEVLDDLTQRLNRNNFSSFYSGLDEFYVHFKNVLGNYQIENNKIVHAFQQASRALVEALQLIKLCEKQRDTKLSQKLDDCVKILAKYGSSEQKTIFVKALKNACDSDINFFPPIMTAFEKYLQEFAHDLNNQAQALQKMQTTNKPSLVVKKTPNLNFCLTLPKDTPGEALETE